MRIVDRISSQSGKSSDDLMDNECVQDYGYDWHNTCDGDHCQECWEGNDYKEDKPE